MPSLKDKIPPHNPDAEAATLGALLLDKSAIGVALQYLRSDDFYSSANGRVYSAIVSLYNNGGRKADILTVTEELRRTGQLDGVGGEAYIAALPNVVPTSANIDYYAQVVRDCALRRVIITTAASMSALAYDESQETRNILEEVQKRIFELTDRGQTLSYKSTYETVPKALARIEMLYHNKQEFTGIASGFEDLDKLTSGFQNSEMIIIGARPSIGKTALALNMAAHIAIRKQIPAAFFTLEMSDISLVMRLLSSESQIDAASLRSGFIQAREFQSLVDAAGRVNDAPLYTVDMPNMKLLDLRSVARRLRSEKKIEIIFIDYLQLISIERYDVPEYEKVSEISRSLKALARELDMPVVALSQVGRPVEGKKPDLSSLRGSGSIEQDADVVMFLHRERDAGRDDNGAPLEFIDTELNLAKQRNGPVGSFTLRFRPKYAQFYNAEKRG
jgi:replicative DNA helicase